MNTKFRAASSRAPFGNKSELRTRAWRCRNVVVFIDTGRSCHYRTTGAKLKNVDGEIVIRLPTFFFVRSSPSFFPSSFWFGSLLGILPSFADH